MKLRPLNEQVAVATAAEIAAECGVSPQAIQVTLHKGLRRFAGLLLARMGHAAIDAARDAPWAHDDPRRML